MKLSQWAKQQGIHYLTANRWFHKGLIHGAYKSPSGSIFVEDKPVIESSSPLSVCIYCRVSTYQKKDDLLRQLERCRVFCNSNGYTIEKEITEIASGMNDKRPKLMVLLDSNPMAIVVEHKDRLTRFGFNYFEKLLPKLGCQLIVINRDVEEKDDLMKDLISIITSFCCRLYGLRRGHAKAKKIKEEAVIE